MSSVLPRFFPKLFVVSPLRLTVSEYRSVALMTIDDSALVLHLLLTFSHSLIL